MGKMKEVDEWVESAQVDAGSKMAKQGSNTFI